MAGFDDPGVYYSDPFFSEDSHDASAASRTDTTKKFKDFIRKFVDVNGIFIYRFDSGSMRTFSLYRYS